jgi:cytochrome c oxidase subunit 2
MKRAATLLLPCLLAACSGPQDYLSPEGPAARTLARLGLFTLILFVAVSVASWLLLWAVIRRRRGSFAEHAPVQETRLGHGWILVGGVVIPLLVLGLVFGLSLHTLKAFPMEHGDPATPLVRVTGQQWWFDAEYRLSGEDLSVHAPTEIHIPVGCPVEFELATRDVIHSFWVPKLHGKVDLIPGMVNRIRVQADRPGVYEGECGEFCGVQHAHMRLQVVAEDGKDFMRWLEHQRADAAEPSTGAERHGQAVFLRAACPLCHSVRGTPARGTVGPDLTHVGARRRIAGGSLDNDTANLAAWISHAQSLKPGAQMPDLTQFDGQELRDLTAYLQSLK